MKVYTVEVSEETVWMWFRLSGDDGCEGVGEATVRNQDRQIIDALPLAIDAIRNCDFDHGAKFRAIRHRLPNVVGRAISSALEQAWLDREGQRLNRPIYTLLGGRERDDVQCYANINRGTTSRKPDHFAQRAEIAANEGYNAIKLAPFDGVTPDQPTGADRRSLVEVGLERVARVNDQLAGRLKIQIDCHSRFLAAEAVDLIVELADLGVTWLEEPILENTQSIPDIVNLKRQANAYNLTFAGAEKLTDLAAFEPFIRQRCYDVIMPDVVLAGGPTEVIRIGYLAEAFGQAVSLHNPCGPVMDMHSTHVAAALPQLHSLERQFRESPLYDGLVSRTHLFKDGAYHLTQSPGLGLAVDWTAPEIEHRTTVSVAI
ncbi:MAG: mandelate racemase/muconate lactonizing enzyme family protein [Hyphomicrobiaceae bacterium]